MPIYLKNKLTLSYKDIIENKFNHLIEFFDYEPGDIFIEILPLEKFDSFYESELGNKPLPFIVGAALNNGRIIILDKKDFLKKENCPEEDFEGVILHELAHMFIRRLNWPEHAFIWIQEGMCEYLSFGHREFKIKKFVDFKEIETKEGWDKHNSYQQAGAFFKFLFQKYGKENLIKFIKGIKQNSSRQIPYFEEVFKNKFGEIQKEFLKNEKPTSSRDAL